MAPENKYSNLPPGAAMALIFLWALSLLLLQFAIWLTSSAAGLDISWLEAAGLSFVWLFTRMWLTALTSNFAKSE